MKKNEEIILNFGKLSKDLIENGYGLLQFNLPSNHRALICTALLDYDCNIKNIKKLKNVNCEKLELVVRYKK